MGPEPDIAAIIPGFLDEVADRLDALERDLDALGAGADPGALMRRIVAALHTIKGSASCLSLAALATAAHDAEGVVEPWRRSRAAPSPDAIRSLRAAIAELRALSESLRLGAAPTRRREEITRCVPLFDMLQHHAALARSRASEAGRAVEVIVDLGAEVMLEHDEARSLSPAILHTLNNCVDHGARAPDERTREGKGPVTMIRLCGEVRPGGRLALTISDDGPGLDRAAIVSRAAALGRIGALDPSSLDDRALQALIFHPGLSTAPCPSIWAGRGVGLEAVRVSVSDMGGSVRVLSTPGVGTTVTFLIPIVNLPSGITDTRSESADAA